jgi:hypothetical protein
MKNFICLILFAGTSLTFGQHNLIGSNSAKLNLKLSFRTISYSDYNLNFKQQEFLNDNLNFSSTENTINSVLKISGEVVTGSALGFGCAMFMKNLIKPKSDAGGLFIGYPIQFFLMSIGATHGTSLGVYSIGKIFGDEGNYWYTYSCSVVTACLFYLAGGIFTQDPDRRLIITSIGLPVGAVIGFNSNYLFD